MPTKLVQRQQQHVELHRKLLLRKRLLLWAVPGAAYVPYIGDGDIAVELYRDRQVYGADIEEGRVETASSRIPDGIVRWADCEEWPFPEVSEEFMVADFDPYADPFPAFREFWTLAEKAKRLVLFFTDGVMRGATYSGHWVKPDGSYEWLDNDERAAPFHFYLTKHVWPWFDDFIRPYRVLHRMQYRRGLLFYWGAVLER